MSFSRALVLCSLLGLLRDDIEAGDEELPIGTEVEVAAFHETEIACGTMRNLAEPSTQDVNNEILNRLETVGNISLLRWMIHQI